MINPLDPIQKITERKQSDRAESGLAIGGTMELALRL